MRHRASIVRPSRATQKTYVNQALPRAKPVAAHSLRACHSAPGKARKRNNYDFLRWIRDVAGMPFKAFQHHHWQFNLKKESMT
jgi:hypothetical protein